MHHLSDKQAAFVLPRPSLTERHRAPTRGPACTHVQVGWGGNSVRQSVQFVATQHAWAGLHSNQFRHGQTRSARCQVRLLRGLNSLARGMVGELPHQPRRHVSLPEACPVRAVVAMGQAVRQTSMQHAFAWWSTPTQRAHRSHMPEPARGTQRRPFSRPNAQSRTATRTPLPTAQILQFKGRQP